MAAAQISLLGQDYVIACAPGQEQRLIDLSRRLNARLGVISEAVGDVGKDRIFILSALALLDELEASRQKSETIDSQKVGQICDALNDAATRLEALSTRITSYT